MCADSGKQSRLDISLVPSQNEGDLKPSTESLVEKKTRLEGGDKWKP